MSEPRLIPHTAYREYPPEEMRRRAADFSVELHRRRSVRDFSSRPVPRDVIASCLCAAGSAPSGAHRQPWHFVAVSEPAIQHRVREAAEAEEREFYARRATPEWLEALAPLGTDASKPFLEVAPWLIAIFAETRSLAPDGREVGNYYVSESVGIATGLLIAAIHHAGLVCLTHTPSPMGFLNALLGRPSREKPFLLLVVGFPAPDVRVPDLKRKLMEAYTTFLDRA